MFFMSFLIIIMIEFQQMNEFHKLLDDNNITLVTSGVITDVQEVDVVLKRLKVC